MAGLEYKSAGQPSPAVDPSCRTLYIAELPSHIEDGYLRNVFAGQSSPYRLNLVELKRDFLAWLTAAASPHAYLYSHTSEQPVGSRHSNKS